LPRPASPPSPELTRAHRAFAASLALIFNWWSVFARIARRGKQEI
jgi:hypothetical protein